MSHVFSQTYYHLIWKTKYAEDLIDQQVEEFLRGYIISQISKLKCRCLEINMTQNHTHLLPEIKPSLSVADFVNQIKGASSHEVNQVFPNKNFYWQTGYGVLTLSKKGIPFVRDYIKKQKEHHQNNTTIPILEYVPEEKNKKKEIRG